MANKLNSLTCYKDYGNTGTSDCDIEEGFPKASVLIPRGHVFSAADTATPQSFITAVQALLQSDNQDQRAYYIGEYENLTPTGENPVVETGNSGRKRNVREGTIGADLVIWDGKQKYREQQKFSKRHREFDELRLDSNNVVWLRSITTDAGVVTSGGRELNNLFFDKYMGNDGAKGGQWTVSMEYKEASQVNSSFGYVDLGDEDLFAAGTGFIPVLLSVTSTGPTNLTVAAKTGYGANLHDLFASELAVVTALLPTNYLTGNAITVSAAASVGDGWTYTVAATGTDPDNPGTGGKVRVKFAAPSVLAALTPPAAGIESNEVIVVLG